MRIGMILDKEFPPDPRVSNEALSLSKAGFEVHLLCFNFGGRSAYERFNGVHIHRIFIPKGIVKKLRALVNTFPFYTMFLKREIERFVEANAIDVLHIHDLYLLGAGLKANQRLRLPVVADLHENYVGALRYYKFSTTFPGNLLISIHRWETAERKWVNAVDRVIVVIEEAAQRLQMLGVPEDKITVVANYVDMDRFMAFGIDQKIIDRFKDPFVISYLGGFDLHRGLESAVKAMPAIVQHIDKAKLVLVGEGKNSDALKQLARELGVDSHICFEGWQDFQTFPSYIQASDVGLIPHLKNVHTDNTIPHKLFHYMLMGKPVVVSHCRPLERIVEETGCGLVFSSGDPARLAKAVIRLYEDSDEAREMGKRGRYAVRTRYNWTNASKALLELYDALSHGVLSSR